MEKSELIKLVKNEAIDNAFNDVSEQLKSLRDDIDFLASEIRDIRSVLRENKIFHKDVLVW